MSRVVVEITMSLDGFVAGPGAGAEQPLGEGGERLHDWYFGLRSWRAAHGLEGGEEGPDSDLADQSMASAGAVVMGRRMFCDDIGPWGDEPSPGRWGEDPPFGVPVFVMTHHPREPLDRRGGTTFTFVTEGVAEAVGRARAAAGDADVWIGGGADVVQQCLSTGLVDELRLHVAPLLLGGGTRLFANVRGGEDLRLEPLEATTSAAVTHLRYGVVGSGSPSVS
jgi:dihydrofolate reductase